MFRIFFLFFFLLGCEKAHIAHIDPEAQPYVDLFIDLIGKPPVGVSIVFVSALRGNRVAQCYLDAKAPLISISRAYWSQYTDYGKENVILHELGHCFLGLDHDNSVISDGCPKSIMYYGVFGNSLCYAIHRDELFQLYKEQSKR